jgi:hypothetical protein
MSRSNDGFPDATAAARRIVLANETRLSVATLRRRILTDGAAEERAYGPTARIPVIA